MKRVYANSKLFGGEESAPGAPIIRGRAARSAIRTLWIIPHAAAREHGLTYGQFMAGLKAGGVTLDRKVLADIAVNEPASFAAIAAQAKAAKPLATPRQVRAEKAARPAKTVKVREARA